MATTASWTVERIPDLTGKTILVTGGNSGIGFEAARQFARKGAHVVLACRDAQRGHTACGALQSEHPEASVEAMELDLASLASVRGFAEAYRVRHQRLDVLCNNAGVMALPYRQTADGFEMQFGTNHLGHFALTGLLLELVLRTAGARVVTVSSWMHRIGRIRFEDLQWTRGYRKWAAYGQSKLANLLFAYELQRRLDGARAAAISVACHPGFAATNLQVAWPRMAGARVTAMLTGFFTQLVAQPAVCGALPTLYAATAPEVGGGDYIGPDGFEELRGSPTKVRSSVRSQDREVAGKLWEISEQLTDVRYVC